MMDFDINAIEGSESVCYVLVPEGIHADVLRWSEAASSRFGINIVLISGMDWNCHMSPWRADGVMKAKKNFSGGADLFLKELVKDLMPNVEQWLKINHPKRYLMGISLSGLFAVWSLFRYDGFHGIASVSGSLWFDGFTDWIRNTPLSGKSKVYLSLGNKEKNAPDVKIASVEDATRATAQILADKGIDITFELVHGTHFSPSAPRFERALEVLVSQDFAESAIPEQ